jgi:hypothetical protein
MSEDKGKAKRQEEENRVKAGMKMKIEDDNKKKGGRDKGEYKGREGDKIGERQETGKKEELQEKG